MRQLFNVASSKDHLGNAEPLDAIYPKYPAPVVRLDDDGERELINLSWGFRTTNKSKKTGNIIAPRAVNNARADKVRSSYFWRFSFEERRCLVPASSFCEWPPGGNPQVFHWFALKGDQPRPAFAFAGLWQTSKYETKNGPETCDTHTVVTTTANELVATVHPNRMPVILRPEDYEQWLHGSAEVAADLLTPYPAEQMHIVRKGEGERGVESG
jgi:putative SOS response-associated peptidase YedK